MIRQASLLHHTKAISLVARTPAFSVAQHGFPQRQQQALYPRCYSSTAAAPTPATTASGASCCHHNKTTTSEGEVEPNQKNPDMPSNNSISWKDWGVWKRASFNTFNCLIGCSIGDFGMLYYLFNYAPDVAANLWVAMPLAMISGVSTSLALETLILKVRERFTWTKSISTAFKMSLVSMLSMELAENATDLYLMQHGFGMSPDNMFNVHEPAFWMSLAISLCAGYITPLPYNYYMLKKHGKSCH